MTRAPSGSPSSAPASPGSGMAIRLKQEGEDDFVLLERAGDIGGTWRDNTYPGCRCDVPSHLYSFSFAPNPNWSSTFSPQAEILDYLKDCAERFGVLPHVRFDTELESAELGRRRRAVADRDVAGPTDRRRPDRRRRARCREPSLPEVPGLESFEGTAFHSAQWDHDHDLDRRARGRDRHRRLGDPVRARDPAEGRQAARLPAHRAVGHPAPQPAAQALGARALPALPAGAARDAGRRSTGRASCSCSSSATAPVGPAARAHAADGTCTRRSRTRSCARSSRPATAWAASASCRPTSGIPRSRSRTSRS